eukprot:CAMPEP_0170075036 /NCGR_PEP_ID=MMETSP0019_2-20121128/12241_1 /TAXON_ID=98059 /ORGANISM="Dinobryon sp., Strain UTEXLB2267" /LENGTH=284 /DNA_ID=CAMNT_0010285739 /DNA_START=515 /DNA_END=1369 /DNA_ORIENTATION=-
MRHAFFVLIVTGPILFSTVLIHELGHCAMAVYLGGSVEKILLWPLGGLASIDSANYSHQPLNDAIVAIAGPLTHIPQIAIWASLMYIMNHGKVALEWQLNNGSFDFLLSLFAAAISIQLALFFFNLLPAYPLDGGKILASSLAYFQWERIRVMQITAMVGGFIGSYMFFSSLSAALMPESATISSGGYYTLIPNNLGGTWSMMLISLFIMSSCDSLWTRAMVESAAATHAVPPTPPTSTRQQQSSASRYTIHNYGSNDMRPLHPQSQQPPNPPPSSTGYRLMDV